MPEQNITLDELAIMIKSGFDDVDKKIGAIHGEVADFRKEANNRFTIVEGRLDRIEKFTLVDFKRRIEKAELDICQIKEALAM